MCKRVSEEPRRTGLELVPFSKAHFPTFQPSEWAFQPPSIKKGHLFLPLPHPFPSTLGWEVWERADGRARPGPRTETGTKRSALKQESHWERSTGSAEDAGGGPAQGPVPRAAVPGSGQSGPKALPHHCLLHQLSAVRILFIVMEALSHHRQRAFTITKGFFVLMAVYCCYINSYSSPHMVKLSD